MGVVGVMLTLAGATAGSALADATINGTVTNTDPTQSGRVFRDAIASTCAVPKTSATLVSGDHHYNAYDLLGTPGTCVSVSLTVPGPDFLFVVAYTSFDPANPTANYLGDPGISSANGTTVTFSFTLPASGKFTLVVSDVAGVPAGGAAYTLNVTGASLGADLSLTKSAAPTSVQHNQNVTYTLTVTNNGPATAVAPTLTDTLPVGQTFVSSSEPSCTPSLGSPVVVTCTLADLPPGPSSVTVTIVARAGTVGAGQTDSATVSSTTPDPDLTNNTATATVNVVPSADLSVAKTSSPNPAIAGQQVTYTLSAHNAGPDTAVNARVVDTLPAGTRFQGASPGCSFNPNVGPAGTVTCPLGDLASGATVTRQIVVLASAGSPVNSATVSSDTADPNAANDTGTTTTTVASSCTVTRTGSIGGSIVVPAGQFLCLVNATVTGAVIVNAGGALSVSNSTIGGGLGSIGARFVTICGSTVKGSVSIRNTTLLVRVGDDDSGCAPNQLRSSLVVSGNQAGVEVFGNTIGGPVSVTNNRGASPLADAAPEVEGNHITGALACSGNIPPVTNDGVTNTAGGAKTGECAGL